MNERTFICSNCGLEHMLNDAIMLNGKYICEDCALAYTHICESCGKCDGWRNRREAGAKTPPTTRGLPNYSAGLETAGDMLVSR